MELYGNVDATRLLVGAMKTAEMNHRYLANNIANADTPGFNPLNIDFQKTLRAVMDVGIISHFAREAPAIWISNAPR